jgi:hypothetical protein
MIVSVDLMKSLPLPTIEQQKRFSKHLQNVHSWYKHLPLLTGGTFIIFLAPDSGTNYPFLHPSLPFGNSIERYRQAFGHLDYMWRINSEAFFRDGASPAKLSQEFVDRFSFIMNCAFTQYL